MRIPRFYGNAPDAPSPRSARRADGRRAGRPEAGSAHRGEPRQPRLERGEALRPARRCARPALPPRRRRRAPRRRARAGLPRRARSSAMLSPRRSDTYSGKPSSRRPASAARWPIAGPSRPANACSTNHGSVSARSLNVAASVGIAVGDDELVPARRRAEERRQRQRRDRQREVGRRPAKAPDRSGRTRRSQRRATNGPTARDYPPPGVRGQALARPGLALQRAIGELADGMPHAVRRSRAAGAASGLARAAGCPTAASRRARRPASTGARPRRTAPAAPRRPRASGRRAGRWPSDGRPRSSLPAPGRRR